jgi:hypothetical protein
MPPVDGYRCASALACSRNVATATPGRRRIKAPTPELVTRRATAVRKNAGLSSAVGYPPVTPGTISLSKTAIPATWNVTGYARDSSGLPCRSFGTTNSRIVPPGATCWSAAICLSITADRGSAGLRNRPVRILTRSMLRSSRPSGLAYTETWLDGR